MARPKLGVCPTCHPAKPYYARGLCRHCYGQLAAKTRNPEDRKALGPLPRVIPDRTAVPRGQLAPPCDCIVPIPRVEGDILACQYCSRRIEGGWEAI